MIRFLLRRIPRFGFVTLFATMLLFVSVAGWAKWNLDLWREEEALLADLSEAGVEYSYIRGSGHTVEKWIKARPVPTSPKPWDPLVPYFSRIESIILRSPADWELRARAARLPHAEFVVAEGLPLVATPSTEAVAAKAGLQIETLVAPTVPTEIAALPDGEPVGASEAASFVSRALESWERSQSGPTRGTANCVLSLPGRDRNFHACDDEMRFDAFDGAVAMQTPESSHAFQFLQGRFEQVSRLDGGDRAKENFTREQPPLIRYDPAKSLDENLAKCGTREGFLSALRESDGVQVERIDERTIRFDLPPFFVEHPAASCRDEYSVSIVARSDLDWELEAWDVRGVRIATPATPKNLPPPAKASYRGALRREGDWVVAEEWVTDWLSQSPAPTPGQPSTLIPCRIAGVARYDFTSDLDLSHVTPELFGAKTLPPRRELPWLRWHRVTFGLSLALLAFVAMRKLFARKLPREDRDP